MTIFVLGFIVGLAVALAMRAIEKRRRVLVPHVGYWCCDCNGLSDIEGYQLRRLTSMNRCGHDYGEGFTSHLNVKPVYTTDKGVLITVPIERPPAIAETSR